MAKLICYRCGLWRNKFAMAIRTTTKKGDKILERKIIGWVCKKCARKNTVQVRPKGMGWREAFNRMVTGLRKNKEAENDRQKLRDQSTKNLSEGSEFFRAADHG